MTLKPFYPIENCTTYYAVIDCDNCFVSCERVFRPDLRNRPIVVLSNNDGCVVARSNEAKAMGVKMGMPFYKMREQYGNQITAFSSNYELYGDMTNRVMTILKRQSPHFIRYSIDEAFLILNDKSVSELKPWGEALHQQIRRATGMPVSIGIASNKTLAKMASHFAKHYAGYRHCCVVDSDERRIKALKQFPIGEVWGIGRRLTARLNSLDITTAYDLASRSKEWMQASFNLPTLRTWKELNGEDAVPTEKPAEKKSICVSRSFDGMIDEIELLRTYVANYATRCAAKLRHQQTSASTIGVFIDTNRFRTDLPQYSNYAEKRLLTPTDSTIIITQTAEECLEKIFRQGYQYKRAGVVVSSTEFGVGIQTNLIDFNPSNYEKMKQLDKVMDKINKIQGSETIVLGSQQFPKSNGNNKAQKFYDVLKHEHRSPSYTTQWDEIIELK